MSEIAIRCEGLGKKYRIGQRERYVALRDKLTEALSAPFRKVSTAFNRNGHQPNASNDTIWALKDVSFEIKHGEVVGVIGRNGAGKSTLLKILSRITEPTTGQIAIQGRVGSLLEVGTGFHPELTGRENVFLNGAILGMKKAEIDQRFDEIVSFAEVANFLDLPVKHYSSGMQMRLAFAVAAHLEPEILVMDEVLAVGDAQFQKKCLGKMEDVAKEGKTVLFVSHNMTAVRSLCAKAIWLNSGEVVDLGDSKSIVAKYLQTASTSLTERVWYDIDEAPGNNNIRLHAVKIVPSLPDVVKQITISDSFNIEIMYWNLIPNLYLNLSMVIHNQEGICVFVSTTEYEPTWDGKPFPLGLFRSVCKIPSNLLNDGMHRVSLLFVKDSAVILHVENDILAFDLQDAIERRGRWYGKWYGAVRPLLEWNTECLNTCPENVKIDGNCNTYPNL